MTRDIDETGATRGPDFDPDAEPEYRVEDGETVVDEDREDPDDIGTGTEIDEEHIANMDTDIDSMIFTPCTECDATFETEQGMKSHRSQVHPGWDDDEGDGETDGDADADSDEHVVATPDDDPGDELDDRETKKRGAYWKWDEARQQYRDASNPAMQVSRRDALSSAIHALEIECDWMSVDRRSDERNFDLWRWVEGEGWSDNGVAHVRERLLSELDTDAGQPEIRKAVMHLATMNTVEEESLNNGHGDRTLVPVANGVIDIGDIEYDEDSMTIDPDSVELQGMDQDHRFTYRIPTPWDPDAADVEGLDEWLETVTVDGDDRRTVWEFAGHALHARYPADGFLILLGEGGSGKSQVLEVVKKMVGDDNTTPLSIDDVESNRFVGQHVVDSRANINTELSGTKLPSIDKLKTLSAGEEIHVEKKGVDGYFSRNDATLMFASDDPPAFPTRNDALGRRLYPVEFPYQFVPDPDPSNPYELQARPKLDVQAELQADARLQAALIRAVEGLTRLLNEGGFTSPATRKESIERYESFADPVLDFAGTCLVDAEPDSHIESGVFKAAFNAFARAKNHDGKTLDQINKILGKSTRVSFTKDRDRNWSDEQTKHTVYQGLKFTEEALENFVPEHALDKLDTSELEDDEDDTDPSAIGDFDGLDMGSDAPECSVVVRFVESLSDGCGDVEVGALFEALDYDAGMSRSRAEAAIGELKLAGEIYQPADGKLRLT